MSETNDRTIVFLSRRLPFPTDPTFREYRTVEELTGVKAQDIMTGAAGVWMLPVLAIIAFMRADKNATFESLSKILDLGPQDITLEGDFNTGEEEAVETTASPETGTPSIPESPDESGTPDSPTTSPEQPESPTT